MQIFRRVFLRKKYQQAAYCFMVAIAAGNFILFCLPAVQAADRHTFNSTHGELQISGELTESACRLDMTSAYQDISLGTIATGRLQNPGDEGLPVTMRLFLRDCLPTYSKVPDERTGQVLWSPDQPVVTVSFVAAADPNNPKLIQVAGASGFGLKLTDKYGQDIRLGSLGVPQFLNPGQSELVYHITPVRTTGALNAGAFSAHINFWLNYN